MTSFFFIAVLACLVFLAVLIGTRLIGFLREPEDDLVEKTLWCRHCTGFRLHYKKQYRTDEISFGRVKFELTGGTIREGWFCDTCGQWTRDVRCGKNLEV